ncbi:hypothetical protein WISP_46359 [Willisornis vidua]|uniref:Uncharacterized protein n=1 Tax=Willisornis vidua TaxID=1566151 RepID=A0ABQ9DFC4_9PASS|nr:hypothetical protein WISP_46359 [Willisornis vidua]
MLLSDVCIYSVSEILLGALSHAEDKCQSANSSRADLIDFISEDPMINGQSAKEEKLDFDSYKSQEGFLPDLIIMGHYY